MGYSRLIRSPGGESETKEDFLRCPGKREELYIEKSRIFHMNGLDPMAGWINLSSPSAIRLIGVVIGSSRGPMSGSRVLWSKMSGPYRLSDVGRSRLEGGQLDG